MSRRPRSLPALLALTLLLAVALRVLTGPGGLGLPRDGVEVELRATRAGSAVVVGAALAAAGVLLQALTHNPLASPSLLGTTSGAGFAVMLWMLTVSVVSGHPPRAGPPVVIPLAGALGSLAAVLALAGRAGFSDLLRLILTGVVLGMVFAAGSMLAQHLLPDRGLAMGARWYLGDLSDDTAAVGLILPGLLVIAALVWSTAMAPAIDASTLDAAEAGSMGVPVVRTRAVLFLLAGGLTAVAVALAGPIGFVGLIGPHVARRLVGPEHRVLIVSAALIGALLLVVSDTGVRLAGPAGGRVPLGVITALAGGPALLLLLRGRQL